MQGFLSYKIIFLVLLSLLLTGCLGRPFPKRLTGSYVGSQKQYSVQADNKTVSIPETPLRVDLQYDHLLIQSEQQKNVISYTISEKTDDFYPLVLTFEDGTIEHWKLYPRGKKLVRTEQAPRPSVTFLKD